MSVGLHRERKTLVSSGQAWLGTIPSNWPTKRIKSLFNCFGGGTPSKDEASYWAGSIPWASPKDFAGSELSDSEDHITEQAVRASATRIIAPGSVMLVVRSGVLRHTIPVAINTVAMALNQDLKALVPRAHLSPEYLRYLIAGKNDQLLSHWAQLGCTVESLDTVRVLNTEVPVPPREEQTAIVSFLDRETARIDALIEKKRRLSELLQEKRGALISRTVTRGLPPDAARVAGFDPHPKLKPSGIDWLGDVPTHWAVLPFTKYVAEKSDYRGKTPEKTQDGVFLVTAKNVRMGYIDYEGSQEYVPEDEYENIMRRGLPRKGDILFTTEAPLGNVALVDREDVALAQRIIRFRMKPEYFIGKFALYGMMSDHFQLQLQSLSTGSTAEGLKASKLPVLRLVAPPVEEQRAIADYLEAATARIGGMVAKVATAIERLQEYRMALITAAVTGKIDVRREMNGG